MSHHNETNPHFLPRQRDPVLEFPSQTPPRRSRPPSRHHGRAPVVVDVPPRGDHTHHPPPPHATPIQHPAPPHDRTSPHHPTHIKPVAPFVVEAPHQPHAPPAHHPPQPHSRTSSPHHATNVKPVAPFVVEAPHQPHQGSRPNSDSHTRPHGRGSHHPGLIQAPTSQRTKPVTWLVAAFCMLFWILVIVGGLIVLIVYLVFRPHNPWFDISTATINAAYLDMGYLLNADVTVLANFSNPNTKVKVDFTYAILDLYIDHKFIVTSYIEPFSVMRGESMFANVHMVASQVQLSTAQSMQLQKQIEQGRMNLDIKGLFKARSKLGGIFHYSYWMYAHCQLVLSGPPTGVLIRKKCITKK
ncbi:hypothetical protein SASPL_115878 [Salvia splendens]|uniref:Late embryogenesis abundant protein LEA-2 subgroup domain-containing protein n=1 Tax=Salvia splendens TaxID=180675 RepID=A0A8X9A212_SALSN|nr:uncharacterized protein LOC121802421 [Salvia splendens]XP_042058028.1 uncharacterized protein LOC121802421 [Salvia splendens]KAG6425443.1 hypothetical protein SASPL_115878 [Salvia splendens]